MNNTHASAVNANISLRILFHLNNGLDLPAAYDAVLGEGAYAKLASDLYDGLRAS